MELGTEETSKIGESFFFAWHINTQEAWKNWIVINFYIWLHKNHTSLLIKKTWKDLFRCAKSNRTVWVCTLPRKMVEKNSISLTWSMIYMKSFPDNFFDIPYIRLFTLYVLSANSSLKPCIKSTRVNFSRNPSESFKIYFICKIVSNLRDCIFHDFDTREHSGKWMHAEKTWIYTVFLIPYLQNW